MDKLNFGPALIKPLPLKVQRIRNKLQHLTIPVMHNGSDRKKTSDKFWDTILQDIEDYERHIVKGNPFTDTCYSKCPESCIKCFDKAYWSYASTGFKKRKFVSIYKLPIKLVSVFLIFLAGLFKMIRANMDGKASFYGNIILATAQLVTLGILIMDKDYIMTLPKMAGFLVALIIIYGIVTNVDEDGIGL
jgi:hypothetical protein